MIYKLNMQIKLSFILVKRKTFENCFSIMNYINISINIFIIFLEIEVKLDAILIILFNFISGTNKGRNKKGKSSLYTYDRDLVIDL